MSPAATLAQLRELTDAMDAAVTRCSSALRYEWVSQAYARWLDRPADEIVGHRIADVIGTDAFDALQPHFARVLAGQRVEYESEVDFAGIGRRWIHSVYAPVFDGAGAARGWVAVVHDITRRKELERAIESARADAEARMREARALMDASRELAASLDVDELLGRVCRIARDLLHADGATFVLHEGDRVRYVAEDAIAPLWKGRTFDAGTCISGWAIAHRETAVVPDVHREPRLPLAAYLPTFVRSLVMAPVPHRAPIAAMGAYWAETREPTAHEVRVLEALADIAAIALQNARMFTELARASRAKDDFLAMLAHELRSPLAPIQNAAALLRQRGAGDGRLAAACGIVERQVTHMSRLVDDLLDVARITRGVIPLRRERLSLRQVVQAAIDAAASPVEERGHTLRASVACDVPLDGDRERLIQVVTNLLANAAKFTPPHGSLCIDTDCDGAEARIAVRDDGIGIAAEAQGRIFDLFHQEEASLARSHGGLGIGLHLVKRIVEMHGGRVAVHSDGPGRGAEFSVWLPVARGEAAPPPRVRTAHAAPASKLRVLVVEDNPDTAESFRMLLELCDHEVRVANDGLAAVDRIAGWQPHVAFVDLGLPGIDGFEVARRVRLGPAARVHLVAVSGYGRDEDKRRAEAAGFDRHLTKPIAFEIVTALLAELNAATVAMDAAGA